MYDGWNFRAEQEKRDRERRKREEREQYAAWRSSFPSTPGRVSRVRWTIEVVWYLLVLVGAYYGAFRLVLWIRGDPAP